ncbi:MAG: group II intron reverse transcriptase/maturase [Candidatus Cloacimonadota bacterium]|nr:MAG: group II intron reverse transcriptase/maturase [Candidatus Cloacimonadota bacterium]
MEKTKSFNIGKKLFVQAFKQVKKNDGTSGIDDVSIEDFEDKISSNLYKLWNRTSSGSYFPPPVLQVKIPKKDGGERKLGIPTVGDRVVQTVVKNILEPDLEKIFHEDSYGYRPKRSAHMAVEKVSQRCRKKAWVLDLDIKGFFDTIPHDLMMKAVRAHTDCKWIILLIERWLKASIQLEDTSIIERTEGTPQGGSISPLLANLFLHYAFDDWMSRNYGYIQFARYADDIVCHCSSRKQAVWLQARLEERFKQVGLTIHPDKTKIAYCKNGDRKDPYPRISFDFLGFTFKPRKCMNRKTKKIYLGFTPAISKESKKSIKSKIKDWALKRLIAYDFFSLSAKFNKIIHGWINYYGKFGIHEMSDIWQYLHDRMASWIRNKYKKVRSSIIRTYNYIKVMKKANPNLFAHWRLC